MSVVSFAIQLAIVKSQSLLLTNCLACVAMAVLEDGHQLMGQMACAIKVIYHNIIKKTDSEVIDLLYNN